MNYTEEATITGKKGTRSEQAVARRCRSMTKTGAANYQRTIIALHQASIDRGWSKGVLVIEGYREIGRLAGLSPGCVGKYIRMAESDKVIRIFPFGERGLVYRVIVLLTHKRAKRAITLIEQDLLKNMKLAWLFGYGVDMHAD